MKTKEFNLTSDRLVVTDPGYDLDTASMDALGVIVSPENGKWKVLPELTNWKEDYFDLTTSQKQAFERLAEHYKTERKRLLEKK